MSRALKSSAVFLIGAFQALAAAPMFEVCFDGKPVFYAEVGKDGQVYKALPKPRVPIGKLVNIPEGRVFVPAESVADTDKYYPLVANILNPRKLDPESMKLLQGILFESKGTTIPLDPIQKWTGPDLSLDWHKISLRVVEAAELEKAAAFEKAVQGKWKFVRMSDWIGDQTEGVLQYQDLEFCPDGKCVADKKEKFYWVDGRFFRLSFQEDAAWENYSVREEYDIETEPTEANKLEAGEIVLRPLESGNPPSLTKPREQGLDYPTDSLKRAYYFKKVAP
jgi:hypothetical protein